MRQSNLPSNVAMIALAGLALCGSALATSNTTSPGASTRRDAIVAAKNDAFAEADANGDGKLTPGEFATFTQLMHQKLQVLRFAYIDANGDGVITKDELAAHHFAGHRGCRGPAKDS
jgi:Ca2+-binding EF-hand superfamily protein